MYDRAIADYTEATRLNPNNTSAYRGRAKAYRSRGETYRERGESSGALEYLGRALLDFGQAHEDSLMSLFAGSD
jgi:tetratricopeptide (TPR) repeat protein